MTLSMGVVYVDLGLALLALVGSVNARRRVIVLLITGCAVLGAVIAAWLGIGMTLFLLWQVRRDLLLTGDLVVEHARHPRSLAGRIVTEVFHMGPAGGPRYWVAAQCLRLALWVAPRPTWAQTVSPQPGMVGLAHNVDDLSRVVPTLLAAAQALQSLHPMPQQGDDAFTVEMEAVRS